MIQLCLPEEQKPIIKHIQTLNMLTKVTYIYI